MEAATTTAATISLGRQMVAVPQFHTYLWLVCRWAAKRLREAKVLVQRRSVSGPLLCVNNCGEILLILNETLYNSGFNVVVAPHKKLIVVVWFVDMWLMTPC
jgi:hypothetical protein